MMIIIILILFLVAVSCSAVLLIGGGGGLWWWFNKREDDSPSTSDDSPSTSDDSPSTSPSTGPKREDPYASISTFVKTPSLSKLPPVEILDSTKCGNIYGYSDKNTCQNLYGPDNTGRMKNRAGCLADSKCKLIGYKIPLYGTENCFSCYDEIYNDIHKVLTS